MIKFVPSFELSVREGYAIQDRQITGMMTTNFLSVSYCDHHHCKNKWSECNFLLYGLILYQKSHNHIGFWWWRCQKIALPLVFLERQVSLKLTTRQWCTYLTNKVRRHESARKSVKNDITDSYWCRTTASDPFIRHHACQLTYIYERRRSCALLYTFLVPIFDLVW